MTSLEKAKKAFQRAYPERTVIKIMDYDSNWYIFEAVENVSVNDFNSPFFAVNKQTGGIAAYSPFDDIDNYLSAVAEHTIYEVKT